MAWEILMPLSFHAGNASTGNIPVRFSNSPGKEGRASAGKGDLPLPRQYSDVMQLYDFQRAIEREGTLCHCGVGLTFRSSGMKKRQHAGCFAWQAVVTQARENSTATCQEVMRPILFRSIPGWCCPTLPSICQARSD